MMSKGTPTAGPLATFEPRLDILPPAQMRLWPELSETPEEFSLYGGTAIALRLGHRSSVDFDFFARTPINANDMLESVPYLKGATVRQLAPNTLTVTVERRGPVQVSFFGGINNGQVEPAERVKGPAIKVASLIDLAGYKLAVVPQRVELKDYIDVHTLLTDTSLSLADMLAAATVIYGSRFNPLVALKALAYLDDPALTDLSENIRRDLIAAIRTTDLRHLPDLAAIKKAP